MDSCNSASLQSSSGGGDDEFDSRCGADDDFDSRCGAALPGFGTGSLIYGLQELRTPPLSHWCSTAPPLPAGAPPSPPRYGAVPVPASDQADAATPAPPRGSRKRARASRRAPTTVLTTDTSNFRAMVQEFTGIPAPPFATARSRFDHLFTSRTTTATGTGSPATLPQYLLRPFAAHKLQAPSTSSPAQANISIAPASTEAASSSDSYHHLTLTGAASPSAFLGMQQQQDHSSSSNYLSFHHQSILDGDAKYAPAHRVFDRGIAPPPSAPRLQYPAADFLGLTHDVMAVGSHGAAHACAHLHPRTGDELSGLVAGASVTGAGGCKATYSSTRPLLERNPSAGVSTAATATTPVAATAGSNTRAQAGVVDSWVCNSD